MNFQQEKFVRFLCQTLSFTKSRLQCCQEVHAQNIKERKLFPMCTTSWKHFFNVFLLLCRPLSESISIVRNQKVKATNIYAEENIE